MLDAVIKYLKSKSLGNYLTEVRTLHIKLEAWQDACFLSRDLADVTEKSVGPRARIFDLAASARSLP